MFKAECVHIRQLASCEKKKSLTASYRSKIVPSDKKKTDNTIIQVSFRECSIDFYQLLLPY